MIDDDRDRPIDLGTTRRLMGCARPHARLFLAAAALMALVAAAELTAPWLTKLAIDRCLRPERLLLPAPSDPALGAALHAAGAVAAADGRLAIAPERLDPALARRLRPAGGGLGEPAVVLPAGREVAGAVAAGGERLLPVAALARLPPEERRAARAGALGRLAQLLGLLLAVLAVRFAGGWLVTLLLGAAGNRVMADLRERVVAHLLRLPVAFFSGNATGRIVTRATNDVAAVNELFTNVLVHVAKDALLVGGALAIMLIADWKLALIVLALSPLMAGLSWTFRRRARAAWREVRARTAALNGHLQETIAGIRPLQAAGREARAADDFAAINQAHHAADLRVVGLTGLFMPLIGFIGTCATALVVWRGGSVDAGDVGTLVAFVAYVELLFAPLRDLAEKFTIVQAASTAAERIFATLDTPAEDRGRGVRPAVCAGRIAFEDVWFSYATTPGDADWVLRGVSFTVEPGHRCALVGPTGAGKTTIVALLLRFHDPQRGRILLDGVDLRDLDLAWLRGRMAAVLQDVTLFAGDVAANIDLHAGMPPERLRAAAVAAGAERLLARPALGERGQGLSAGERQLVAIARAFADQPAVLLLDEATASVDPASEALVQRGLAQLLAGRTAVIVAHRLATVRDADGILVLRHGAIVERGRHADLLAQDGLYAALVRHQQALAAVDADQRP